jgi:hypothetical protein
MIGFAMLTQPDERPDKLEDITFDTTTPSELYFKNVRSFYYRQTEEGDGILHAYRLKSLYDNEDEIFLPFVIYHNWRSKEAYIRLDTNFLVAVETTAYVLIEHPNGVDSFAFPDFTHDSQFAFARDVYRALRDDKDVRITGLHAQPIALTGQKRIASQRVLTDYFKLIEKL